MTEKEDFAEYGEGSGVEQLLLSAIAAVFAAFAWGDDERIGVHLVVTQTIAIDIDGRVDGLHERLDRSHALAGNIIGRAVVGRGAHDVETGGEVHAVVHRQRLEGRETLIVVHGQHRIEVAKRTGTEESISTVGAEAGESLAVETLHEGGEQFHLFAAVQSLVAVVGVEAEHGNAGSGDAKVASQGGVEALELRFDVFGRDFFGHFAQRKVGGDECHAHERVEQDHEGFAAADGLEKFRVAGIAEVGRLDVSLVDGTGDQGVDAAGMGRCRCGFERAEGHATGFGRGTTGLYFHFLVADHVNQVEAVGMRVFGLLDAVPMHVEFQGFAVVGGHFLAAVDDGGAKFQEFGLGKGFEDEFIADAVGVAVGDGDAYLSVHCDWCGGVGKMREGVGTVCEGIRRVPLPCVWW